jgi:intracellular sulfur oxidation DsrE/DsrF family protein
MLGAPQSFWEPTMRKRIVPVIAAILFAAGSAASQAAEPSYPGLAGYDAVKGMQDMKIVFDVTEGNPKVLAGKLATIDVTRKQLIEAGVAPHIVVAFRGDASYYTQDDVEKLKPEDRAEYAKVHEAIRQLRKQSGVDSVEQCSLPLPARKIDKARVMPEVTLVPNGWIAVVAYQQKGYAYIAP